MTTPTADAPRRVATIGVYGFNLETFLDALQEHDVVCVYDVRQRRGVRGPEYAWANAQRLIAALDQHCFNYEHHRDLAPTTELRQLQYAEDARQGVGKRSRTLLAPEYADRYVNEILDAVDLPALLQSMPTKGTTALLCVERDPEACHRSLITTALEHLGAEVTHLRP